MPFSLNTWLVLIGALGLWLGFPNVVYHVPVLVLLYPLSLFLLGARAKNKTDALRKGWIVGLLGSSAALYWLAIPIHNVGGLPWPLAIPCAWAIGAYVGFYGGVFSLSSYILKQRLSSGACCVALACIWYGLEFLRGIIFTGFPWLQISTAFVPWPIMLQAASIVGGCALSAIYVCATLLVIEGLTKHQIKQRLSLALTGIGLIGLVSGFGFYTIQQNPFMTTPYDDSVNFIMAEGNIDQNIKWEPHTQASSLELYKNLTLAAIEDLPKKQAHSTIIIWPETAMPFYLGLHPTLTTNLAQFVRDIQLPLIVGSPGMIRYSKEKREIFNRAYLLSPQGKITSFYDKVHLVPFGEYVPSWLLINFLEPLLQGIGNFTPGRQSKPLIYDELALGILICYESIFANIARARVADGANILVNISNDGWFGDSAAPEQHLQLGIARAMEQGRWLVRSTNTGISAIVDNFGRFILKGEQFKAQSLSGFAKPLSKNSIYFHLGPWLPYAVGFVFALAFILGRQRNYITKR